MGGGVKVRKHSMEVYTKTFSAFIFMKAQKRVFMYFILVTAFYPITS